MYLKNGEFLTVIIWGLERRLELRELSEQPVTILEESKPAKKLIGDAPAQTISNQYVHTSLSIITYFGAAGRRRPSEARHHSPNALRKHLKYISNFKQIVADIVGTVSLPTSLMHSIAYTF